MLEYILFSEKIRDIFVSWLKDNDIEYQLAGDDEELLILIDENIDESIEEKIEDKYDQLLDESAKVVDEEDDPSESIHHVGVQFTNSKGDTVQLRIPPEMANKIQQCLSARELQAFVQMIADAVENPNNDPLCKF